MSDLQPWQLARIKQQEAILAAASTIKTATLAELEKSSLRTYLLSPLGHRRDCGHDQFGVVSYQQSNGQTRFRLACVVCGLMFQSDIAHYKLSKDTKGRAPLVRENDGSETYYSVACIRCGGRDGVQNHHWAPRIIFGFEDAESWPQAPLCQSCHSEWHQKMGFARHVDPYSEYVVEAVGYFEENRQWVVIKQNHVAGPFKTKLEALQWRESNTIKFRQSKGKDT